MYISYKQQKTNNWTVVQNKALKLREWYINKMQYINK